MGCQSAAEGCRLQPVEMRVVETFITLVFSSFCSFLCSFPFRSFSLVVVGDGGVKVLAGSTSKVSDGCAIRLLFISQSELDLESTKK